jgi:hypothetical protein
VLSAVPKHKRTAFDSLRFNFESLVLRSASRSDGDSVGEPVGGSLSIHNSHSKYGEAVARILASSCSPRRKSSSFGSGLAVQTLESLHTLSPVSSDYANLVAYNARSRVASRGWRPELLRPLLATLPDRNRRSRPRNSGWLAVLGRPTLVDPALGDLDWNPVRIPGVEPLRERARGRLAAATTTSIQPCRTENREESDGSEP